MDEFINISGLEGLTRDLADLPKAIVRDLFPDALAAGGEVLEGALKARTPEDDEASSAKEYGTMKADIGTTVKVDAAALSGSARTGMGITGYKVRFVEYGFRRTTHKGKEVGHQAANPFMRVSAEAASEAAIDAFVEALTDSK